MAGGSAGPRVAPSVSQGWFCASQGACGRAVIRAQAVAMACAQGQVAGIFSRRRRPPRTSFPAACRTRSQGLWFCSGQVAVQGDEPQPGQQGRGDQGDGQPRGVHREVVRGEPADPAVLPGTDAVLNPGVHPVGSVDVAQLGAPAAQPGGHVRYPQAVTPAVLGLEQAQLGTGVRPLPAGEDAHRLRPAVQLVPSRAFAQQPGQLGDVRFFDPAPRMPAGLVRAGTIGAALAHLAALIDGDLPGLLRDEPDRGALAGAQLPADRVGQLIAAAGRPADPGG